MKRRSVVREKTRHAIGSCELIAREIWGLAQPTVLSLEVLINVLLRNLGADVLFRVTAKTAKHQSNQTRLRGPVSSIKSKEVAAISYKSEHIISPA